MARNQTQTYTVSIQCIDVYEVDVSADSPDEALELSQQLNFDQIKERGKLRLSETDYHEIIEQSDLDENEL